MTAFARSSYLRSCTSSRRNHRLDEPEINNKNNKKKNYGQKEIIWAAPLSVINKADIINSRLYNKYIFGFSKIENSAGYEEQTDI